MHYTPLYYIILFRRYKWALQHFFSVLSTSNSFRNKHKVATYEIGHRKRQASAKLPTTLYRTLITRKSINFNCSRFHELNLYLSVFQSYVIVRKGLVFVFHIKEKKMREVNKVEVLLKQGVQGNSIVLFL